MNNPFEDVNMKVCRCCQERRVIPDRWGLCSECGKAVANFIAMRRINLSKKVQAQRAAWRAINS